ncbi:MAG: aminotransferase class V-fold PLP-dependent enzyme [Rubrobacteraceae bacterium]
MGGFNTLTYVISRALAKDWDETSEIVVTELDHRANVDPWIQAAKERGAKIRWIPLDSDTLTLNEKDIEEVITENTRLVAVGLASNIVGTISDVAKVANLAHKAGALVAVDAVHAAPHIPIDRDELGADILTCSAYKFFGRRGGDQRRALQRPRRAQGKAGARAFPR